MPRALSTPQAISSLPHVITGHQGIKSSAGYAGYNICFFRLQILSHKSQNDCDADTGCRNAHPYFPHTSFRFAARGLRISARRLAKLSAFLILIIACFDRACPYFSKSAP